jgi:hypothetical protein
MPPIITSLPFKAFYNSKTPTKSNKFTSQEINFKTFKNSNGFINVKTLGQLYLVKAKAIHFAKIIMITFLPSPNTFKIKV